MNRLITATAIGLLVLSTTATAQRLANRGRTVRPRNTLAVLNQRIEEINFDEAPLDEVMSWIGEVTKLNVMVKWQILEDLGIERDKPISIHARNLRLSQILWMIMSEAGGSDVKLAYRASGNLLVLSTAEDLGSEMIVRVYDVSDLLVRIPRFRGSPRIDIQQVGQSAGSGIGGGGTTNIFGGSTGGNTTDDDDQRGGQGNDVDEETMQRLIDLIQTTIEPDTWAINGGEGTIQAFGRQLIVRNNILVHQLIGGPVETQK